jgi:hypothetical protein
MCAANNINEDSIIILKWGLKGKNAIQTITNQY